MSSTTCAKEKIASFDPSVGITFVSGSSVDTEATIDPAGHRLTQLRQADGGGIAHPLAHAVSQRLDDAGIGRLSRVAHSEVDHLEALGPPGRGSLVQAHERVCRLSRRMGEMGTAHVERKRDRVSYAAHERIDLDQLVTAVGVPRRAGTEVDRVDAAGREVCDVRPRLLRLEAGGRPPRAGRARAARP